MELGKERSGQIFCFKKFMDGFSKDPCWAQLFPKKKTYSKKNVFWEVFDFKNFF